MKFGVSRYFAFATNICDWLFLSGTPGMRGDDVIVGALRYIKGRREPIVFCKRLFM